MSQNYFKKSENCEKVTNTGNQGIYFTAFCDFDSLIIVNDYNQRTNLKNY